MAAFAWLVLAALLAADVAMPDLGAELARRLRAEVGEVESVEASVELPPESRGLGHVRRVSATVTGVDARRLPLAVLVPLPRPHTPKGRLDHLELRAVDAHLDEVRASEVVFAARDVTYDLLASLRAGEVRVTGVGEQSIRVTLRNGDLDAYAAVAYPELSGTQVTFKPGRLVVRAQVPLIFAAFPVRVSGTLAIEEGRRLVLREPELDTGRVELSETVRQDVLKRLNPIVDLDESLGFPVPIEWTGVEVGDGEARLFGRLEAVEVPLARPAFWPRSRYER